jgi:hypothetical protein
LLESKKIADLADIYYMPVTRTMSLARLAPWRRPTARRPSGISGRMSLTGYPVQLGTAEAWEKYAIYDRPFIKDGRIQPDKRRDSASH